MSGALFLIILLFLKNLLFCILFKLIPGAGLSVDELAAAAPHTIHFLLQTAAVPEFHFFIPFITFITFYDAIYVQHPETPSYGPTLRECLC